MVIRCEGSADEVYKRLESLANEWRESAIPAATRALGINHWELKRIAPRQFAVSVRPPGRGQVFALSSPIEVIEDLHGTAIRFDLRPSPPLSVGLLAPGLLLLVPAAIFQWTIGSIVWAFVAGGALSALSYGYAQNRLPVSATGVHALLRLAATPVSGAATL